MSNDLKEKSLTLIYSPVGMDSYPIPYNRLMSTIERYNFRNKHRLSIRAGGYSAPIDRFIWFILHGTRIIAHAYFDELTDRMVTFDPEIVAFQEKLYKQSQGIDVINSNNRPKYLSITGVCEYLNISKSKLDRLRSIVKIPSYKNSNFPEPDLVLGRSPRWKVSTIDTWTMNGGSRK